MQQISESTIFGIDPNSVFTPTIMKRLEESSRLIGGVNQISSNIFQYDFIIEALKNIEALASARIEGTTGNLEDLYQQDELNYEQKRDLKLFSAFNYRTTINELEDILGRYGKIDLPVIQYLHKHLTEKDPATKGVPGEFRNKDVKIANSKLGDFFPPSYVRVQELMRRYIAHDLDALPELIQIAIRHYQFESIHPFEDGNGRAGRLLMTARLLESKIVQSPILNLSQYFEAHRDEYLSSLRLVSDNLDYTPWINFFLDAVKTQCTHNIELIGQLRGMKKDDKKLILENIRMSSIALHILDFSLNHLFITIPDTSEFLISLGLPIKDPYQAARNNIHALERLGILSPHHKRSQAVVYVNAKLKKLIIG
jgi:Fic family protein